MRWLAPALLLALCAPPARAEVPLLRLEAAPRESALLVARQENISVRAACPAGNIRATHVVIRPHSSNDVRMRDANGYFRPWNGQHAALLDTGARCVDGVLTFKILQQPLAGESLPLSVWVAARVNGDLLSATFRIAGE